MYLQHFMKSSNLSTGSQNLCWPTGSKQCLLAYLKQINSWNMCWKSYRCGYVPTSYHCSTIQWLYSLRRWGRQVTFLFRPISSSAEIWVYSKYTMFCITTHSRYSDKAKRMKKQGLNLGGGDVFPPSPQHPYRLWGPPSLLSNGYWG
jgi:hypothetical protein